MEAQAQTQSNLAIPGAIVIAGLFIAGAIFMTGGDGGDRPEKVAPWTRDTTNEGIHVRGNVDAPIYITEYSDTECPYCQRFHNTMVDIMNKYGQEGSVAWQYKHLPLEQIHPNARAEAGAAECAAELGGNDAFWLFIDDVIAGKSGRDVLAIAESHGLDRKLFLSCTGNNIFDDIVTSQATEASSLGAQGTPFSIISHGDISAVINGAQPIQVVAGAIDILLAGGTAEDVDALTFILQNTGSIEEVQLLIEETLARLAS